MSKALESAWAIYPEHWNTPGAKELFALGFNAAIEAAAKMLEERMLGNEAEEIRAMEAEEK